MTDIAQLAIVADSRDLITGKKRLGEFTSAGALAEGGVAKMAVSAKRSFGVVALAAGSALAALAGVGAAVGTIKEFGSAMSQVEAITRATGSEMAKMRDIAKELGSTTEFSAAQAASGLRFLGQAGFTASESMAAIPAVLDLATAAALDLGQAADITSNVMSGFGIAAANAAQVTDVLAAAASRSNTDVSQLGQAMSTVAPISAALDISLAGTAAAIGTLSDAGIQGARAGTALRGVLASLAGPTSQAENVLQGLGLTIADVDPATNGLADVLEKLGTAGLTTAGAMEVFGREAASGALVLIDGAARVREFGQELTTTGGAAAEMAGIMRDNLQGDINGLLSSVQGLAIALGDAGLTAVLRGAVQFLTGAARAATLLADAIGGTLGVIGSVVAALTGYGAATREIQAAADVANLAIADELAQVGALTSALSGGRTMSRQTAEVKLLQAQAHLTAADAIRQENIEAVKQSASYEMLQNRIDGTREVLQQYKDLQAQGEVAGQKEADLIKILNDQLSDAVNQQREMLIVAGEVSTAYVSAQNEVDRLSSAIDNATGEMVTLGGETINAADTTESLARLAGSINFDGAIVSASALAEALGISLSIAARIQGMSSESRAGVSGPDGAIASLQGEGRLGGGPLQGVVSTLNVGPRFNPTSGGGSGGGSGGSGGVSEAQRAAEKLQNDNHRDAERIMNGLLTVQDEYNDALDQANRLRDVGVLPLAQYSQHVSQLRQELTDTEWDNSGLKPFIDDLSQAGLSMEGLADVFEQSISRMAQSWLSSGLTSLGQSLMGIGGGSASPLGGIAASLLGGLPSFNGGGSTGNGSRSGGLDGMGGFLAINHPQETIIDHTKGNSGGSQAPVINITVNGARGNAEIVEMVGLGVSAGIKQNNKRMATAQGRPT